MKKFYSLFMMLCICLWANAQATDLVVDCQTPGWLSSMIKSDDQQTVKNLKVTGHINKADLQFIGSLVSNQNLNGVIDIGDAAIVGDESNPANVFYGSHILPLNPYSNNTTTLRKFICPKTVSTALEVGSGFRRIDTLVYDCMATEFGEESLTASTPYIKHLIIGENITSIAKCYYSNGLYSIHFPSSLKTLSDFAFYGILADLSRSNITIFPSLEYMGKGAFVNNEFTNSSNNRETLPDTMYLPQIKYFNAASFDFKTGMHVHLGESLKTFKYEHISNYGGNWVPNLHNVFFHLKTSTPPTFDFSDGSNIHYVPEEIILCIPKGSREAYTKVLNDAVPRHYTLIEEDVLLEQILLSHKEIIMDAGEKRIIDAVLLPEDVTDTTIVWSVDNDKIVSISQTGEVTALSPGETNIHASSTDGQIQATCKVIVRAHAESVSIESSIYLSKIGDTWQLTPVISPDNSVDKSVVWKSSNEQVCTVSATGLVTATGIGTAIITVTTVDGGHTATCIVKVLQHVSALALDKHSLKLKVGEQDMVRATVSPDNADDKAVVWFSANDVIATVDDKGNVKALKAGEVWIKAVSNDNTEAKDSCKVTVMQPVTGVTLTPTSYRLTNIGETVELVANVLPDDATNKEVKWTSSNEAVCMVANGKVVATGFGTAVVLVSTVEGGFMASCTVVVEKEAVPVTAIVLSQTSATLIKGETLLLTATVSPNDATNKNIIWKSSDETVCAVTQNGLIIAIGEGKSVVTVVPENGICQAQCDVTVKNEEAAIQDVMIGNPDANAPIYDMMGRKVNSIVKGRIYIRSGKTFVAQ